MAALCILKYMCNVYTYKIWIKKLWRNEYEDRSNTRNWVSYLMYYIMALLWGNYSSTQNRWIGAYAVKFKNKLFFLIIYSKLFLLSSQNEPKWFCHQVNHGTCPSCYTNPINGSVMHTAYYLWASSSNIWRSQNG